MDQPLPVLELDSQLSELIRAQVWIDELADWNQLGDETRYAIQLCMEEALANVVLHAYRNEAGHRVVIRSWTSDGSIYFAIEDEASPFAPNLMAPFVNAARPELETMKLGGNGIKLIHRFSKSLAYERIPGGNRLTIGFPVSAHKDVSV